MNPTPLASFRMLRRSLQTKCHLDVSHSTWLTTSERLSSYNMPETDMRSRNGSVNWLRPELQGLITWLCGLIALVAALTAPVNRRIDFGLWVAINVLLCLIVPLSISHAMGWRLTDVGWRTGNVKRGVAWVIASLAIMLPVLVITSRRQEFQSYYPLYAPARYSMRGFLQFAIGITIYMCAWEFLFRGYLLFGGAKAFGAGAIIMQALPFWMAHIGKPVTEFWSALPGGIIMGIIAWHSDSFWAPFVIHALINVLFNAFVICLPPTG